MAGNDQGASQGVVGKVCPKCGYARKADEPVPETRCPKCRVLYAKAEADESESAAVYAVSSVTPEEEATNSSEPAMQKLAGLLQGDLPKKHVVLIGLFCLVLGYYAGREHLKYEMRSAFSDAFSGIAEGFKGLSDAAQPVDKQEPSIPDPESQPIQATLIRKGFSPKDLDNMKIREEITFTIRFENQQDRDIRAFDGIIHFVDLLGNSIISLRTEVNDPVPAYDFFDWHGLIDYNEFKDSERRLRAAEQQNIRAIFEPRKILYADGTVEQLN
ncbi:hypothetical protein [Marinobacterium litorale]|uniref:hypothetical protein n=1 Tax=Marinobacterium litorale TaxID=404770 RepID=UPI000407AFF8|nr:hypothetical protein [Marinobacterium litorale]